MFFRYAFLCVLLLTGLAGLAGFVFSAVMLAISGDFHTRVVPIAVSLAPVALSFALNALRRRRFPLPGIDYR